MSKQEEELSKALNEAQEEEVLNQEEMDATSGGSFINLSKSKCGDTVVINNVAGCACTDAPKTVE